MHSYTKNETPAAFKDRFAKINNKYSSRSSGLYKKPFCRTKMTTFSISYRAPHIWNEFVSNHPDILTAESTMLFKKISKKGVLKSKMTDSLF